MPTAHIESSKNDIANIVLMPGDPKRAKYIADNFLENVKLVNQVRAMTAYTGYYKGKKITIFPSGMGNPSIGIYSYELFKYYDVDTIIRIGTIGGYSKDLKVGDVVLAETSVTTSNYALIQNGDNRKEINSNMYLNNTINNVAKDNNINLFESRVLCSDVFYDNSDYKELENKYNVVGVEMETFALFHTADMLNKKATALLTISNSFATKEELTSEERERNLNEMIKLALESSLKI
jgi:purine-nucleoside phosphorylase